MKILLVDNYDSFTYNLVHLFAQIDGTQIDVVRNDEDFLGKLKSGGFGGVIISPGPGDPTDQSYFGNNMQLINDYSLKGLPILGVCLGFQGIASFFGAKLKKAKAPMHGKTSRLRIIEPDKLLAGVPDGVEIMRYHSLMIDADKPLPKELVFTAETDSSEISAQKNGREIMALCHRDLPIYGVQFHPESFATEQGKKMAENFIKIIRQNK